MNERDRALARAKPLPLRLKGGYALGQMVDAVVSNTLGLLLLFYLTTVCGLPGALAGFALAAGMVFDAVLDPLIGTLSDSYKSGWGRRLPFMMAALPLIVLMLLLLFNLPTDLPTGPLFGIALLLSVLLRISVSIFNVPYQALTAELTEDYQERSSLSAWRWAVSIVGTLAVLILSFSVFFSGPDGMADRSAYAPLAITISVFVGFGALGSMWAVYQLRDREHLPTVSESNLLPRMIHDLREAIRNPSFVVLVISGVLFFTAIGAHGSLALHINSYFWKLDTKQIQMLALATYVGLLFGAPIAGPMLKRLEKRTVVMIGMGGLAVSGCLPATLRLLGLFPFEGQVLAVTLACILFSGGVLMAGAAIAYGAMMADATDEHEHRFGSRREGLYFAGWAFASKTANGAGGLVAGIFIQLSGFPVGKPASETALSMDSSSLTLLALLYAVGSGVMYVAAIAVVQRYRLNETRHRAIIADLNVRRAGTAASATHTT